MNTRDLRQKRAGLIKLAREILDLVDREKRSISQEETNRYDALWSEISDLAAQIEKVEKLEEAERGLIEPANRDTRPQLEPENGTPRRNETKEYRAAFNSYLRGAELAAPERRELYADSNVSGGYLLAPAQMVQGILKAADNLVFMRQWATVQQVTGGADGLGMVSLDADPADPTWTSELAIGTEDSTIAFGKRELTPHPLAKFIKVSRKLLRKVPSVEPLVISRLGYKFGVTMENNYQNGNGAGQPLGVFTASANGITTARDVSTGNTTTTIQFDGLKEAKYTLKGQYWARAKWLFHRNAVKQIAKLQDDDGQYIWADSVQVGEPDRLLGFPAFMSEYSPSTFTTGLYVGILGDFSYYYIADDLNIELQRLDELYAATNQVGFIGRLESDGMPCLAEAFVRVKLA